MGAPAIFEKQIEIKLLHPASTEGVTDSGWIQPLHSYNKQRQSNSFQYSGQG
ncbi:MAG: hypothetical protein P8X74_05570 [Reinekea sp.]